MIGYLGLIAGVALAALAIYTGKRADDLDKDEDERVTHTSPN